MSRALCCPDKFRGSLTAAEAAAALALGARDAGIDETVEIPLADGGEGTLDALLGARGGERREDIVTGPLGEPVRAAWGLLPDGTAVVEMARASGLALVPRERRDAVRATTRGTGELIAKAAAAGARSVLVGVGGSATTDGGLGAVEALGWELPVPVVVACDVETRFLDAPAVFGPQKGARPAEVTLLAERLAALATRYRDETGVDVVVLDRAGAAGGLAGGLAALGADLCDGFGVVAAAVGLEDALEGTALILTGEGRLDLTSLAGKTVGGVLRLAALRGFSVGIAAGVIAPGLRAELPPHACALSLVEVGGSLKAAYARPAALLREAAARLAGAG
ncbi:MAG: glycerate kinase [Thermoleophilia bacterium]|nr:glycerate kinase [Thermoleophilia bacterium]